MKYFLFIDESGDANIKKSDVRFNIFVLCGILFKESEYDSFNERFKNLKSEFFNKTEIIFHSYEMRNKVGEFELFKNLEIQDKFYSKIQDIFQCDYKIISSVINKDLYRIKYPHLDNAYEDSLTFICERAIRYIQSDKSARLYICLEKRGKLKDAILKKYYSNFVKYGTMYLSTYLSKICIENLYFRGKEENINGLQFADLCAYPIARKFLSPNKVQPTFNLFENKLLSDFKGNYLGIGIKTFP